MSCIGSTAVPPTWTTWCCCAGRHHVAIHEEGFTVSSGPPEHRCRLGVPPTRRRSPIPRQPRCDTHQSIATRPGHRPMDPETHPARTGAANRSASPTPSTSSAGHPTSTRPNRCRHDQPRAPWWSGARTGRPWRRPGRPDQPASDPVAVFHANRVQACTAAARAEGVHVGQRRRDAQSRCPDLLIAQVDPDRDGRLFEPVAAAVESIAPGVEILRSGVVACPGPRAAAATSESTVAAAERIVDVVEALDVECSVGYGRRAGGRGAGRASRGDRPAGGVRRVLRTAADHRAGP